MPLTPEAMLGEQRARERARLRAGTEQPRLPEEAEYGERCAIHGDDSGAPFRREVSALLAAISKAMGTLHNNPTLNESQKVLSAADYVTAKAGRIYGDFDGQRSIIASKTAAVEGEIDNALRPPRSEWQAGGAELRSVLRGMDDKARFAFFDALKGTRDELMVQYAVAGVPAALSGVPYEIHKKMRDTLLQRQDPTLLTRPDDLKRRAELLKVCEDGVRTSIAEFVDFDKAAALKQLVGDSP